MKQDESWLPRSPLGWAVGFSGTLMLFASVYAGERPVSPTLITVTPKITTVTVRTVAHSPIPFVSHTVCVDALHAERRQATGTAQLRDLQVGLYHCERMEENASLAMVGAPSGRGLQ